ncbi:MAG: (deoxy)nucleoside triphosphate pyrophosphohydrolase [Deltaproteobacteria bacterium]|nr:MAG: (deoxy)nucleoside triphosphate pyrophosphohydrolase [Deltaproteobacteria bacterium]
MDPNTPSASLSPLRVVAGVLIRRGAVLAALRGPGRPLAGSWEFPGGKVEDGESDRAALRRELREELDIDVEVGERLGISRWSGGRRPILLVAYRCVLTLGEPIATEHEALAWLRPHELGSVPWAPADIPLLPSVERALSR